MISPIFLEIAVVAIGIFLLLFETFADEKDKSFLAWLGVAAGSLAFGYGMAQAGGCVQRCLVRVGGGSVKSAVTLVVIAVSAMATLHVVPSLSVSDPPGATSAGIFGPALIIGLALLAFCLRDSWFRASPGHLWGGVGIGAVVALSWPMADGLNPLMTLGRLAELPVFGIAALVGIALGAFVAALARSDLILDRFVDREDVQRHLIGGILMGVGGACAGGCSFGQGLTGFATLAPSAVIAIAGMIAGCLWGIRALEAGSAWGGLRLLAR